MFIFPILGIFIPLPGVLLTFIVPEWSYVINQFPPLLCSSQNINLLYYSLNLPLNILLAFGVSLFVVMLWKLHKVRIIILTYFNIPTASRYISHQEKSISLIINTAEKKILIALCYYVIFAEVMLVYFGVSTADTDLFIEALGTYFHCEALGHLPNQTSQCDPKEYQQYTYPELAATTHFLNAFVTTANLTFVINWNTVTKFCSRCYRKQGQSLNVMSPNTLLPFVSDITDSSHLQ